MGTVFIVLFISECIASTSYSFARFCISLIRSDTCDPFFSWVGLWSLICLTGWLFILGKVVLFAHCQIAAGEYLILFQDSLASELVGFYLLEFGFISGIHMSLKFLYTKS